MINSTPCLLAVFKLYCTWNNLSKLWNDCHKKLEESLQMALHYQDTMQVRARMHSHILTNVSRSVSKHKQDPWPPLPDSSSEASCQTQSWSCVAVVQFRLLLPAASLLSDWQIVWSSAKGNEFNDANCVRLNQKNYLKWSHLCKPTENRVWLLETTFIQCQITQHGSSSRLNDCKVCNSFCFNSHCDYCFA